MIQSYDDHVKEALNDVNNGEHLRFINFLYRTKEVCLIAVEYESTHSLILNDIYSVPIGNLDYVMDHMKEVMKNNPEYLKSLEEAYIQKKKKEKVPGYYGKFETYQDLLDYYQVNNYDDMLHKMYYDTYKPRKL